MTPNLPPQRRKNLRTSRCLLVALLSLLPLSATPAPLHSDVRPEVPTSVDNDRNIERLRSAYSLFPYDEEIRSRLAAAYVERGKSLLERKQFDAAADSFGLALEIYPDSREFAVMRGIALYGGKRYDEAAIVLDQLVTSGENSVVALYYLGRVRYDTGDLAGALELWDRVIALDPGNKGVRDIAEKARRESAVESRMGKDYRAMFVVSYDEGTKSNLADNVLEDLESAYVKVGSDLDYYPTVRIPVLLYTRKDYQVVTAGPEWSGGLYDGKVRLPIGGASAITPMLRGVLFHEYAHVVVGELTRKNCPSWLNEGIAEVEGRTAYSPPLDALAAAAQSGKLLPVADLEKPLLGLNSGEAALAYQQSYHLVRFMIASYGWHKIREILVNLGSGMTIEKAIAATFADFGLDYRGIVREWQDALLKEYGK